MSHDRYRRIIDAYRQALLVADPATCRAVDSTMDDWGEYWISDGEVPDVNALMSAAQIAKKWGFQRWDIANWVKAGKISPARSVNGIPVYRLGDVLAHFASKG